MKFKLPEEVIKVLNSLEAGGFKAYVVGGAIRDLMTQTPVTDWDFTTDATPEEIQKLFPDSFYDNAFGTVGVKLNEELVVEITTFRSESGYSDRRRPDSVIWGKTIEEDLKRRDFTINAMALKTTKIIDPFDGQQDLKARIVRAVGDPQQRFGEDALRMMRAIRIASQLGFLIEPKTMKAITDQANLIKAIAKERVRDELLKIIASPFPKEGVMLLYNSGLLEHIVPELIATRGVIQGGHHTKDVWNHSLDSLAASPSPEPIVRLATLLHDIGKPQVQGTGGKNTEITFYNHEVVGARMAKTIARRLKLSKKQIDLLWLLVRWHMFQYEPKMTDKAIRRFITRVGRENINRMILLRVGDRVGGGSKASSWRLREFQERIKQVLYKPFEINDLKVDGNDVMQILRIKPGPKVGGILKKLFAEVLDDAKKNEREYLLERIKTISV